MTDRELQKLKRVELLQLLVEQSRELDALRRELEETKKQLADAGRWTHRCRKQ